MWGKWGEIKKFGGEVMTNLYFNGEKYPDPTAYNGTKEIIKEEFNQQKRVNELIFVIKYLIKNAGFEMGNKIVLKDKKTGKEYR